MMALERNPQVIREGELTFKVRREVVSHLSWRLYRNFARGVKELISNSYDNEATEVKIKLAQFLRDEKSEYNPVSIMSEIRDVHVI